MNSPLELAISPCPNDTFAFDALVHGRVEYQGPKLSPVLMDIEELNRRALNGHPGPAITKLSIPAFARVLPRYVALRAGAALGFGVGPVVVSRAGGEGGGLDALTCKRIAIPGIHTSAALLLRHFLPEFEAVEMRFDRISESVKRGEVDAGVLIHEGRFTFADLGLARVADLGEQWERRYELPLGLAVIGLRRDLVSTCGREIESAISKSVAYAQIQPEVSWPYIRKHAQEMDVDVCRRHIELYVSEDTRWLTRDGEAAIRRMLEIGDQSGIWNVTEGWGTRFFLSD